MSYDTCRKRVSPCFCLARHHEHGSRRSKSEKLRLGFWSRHHEQGQFDRGPYFFRSISPLRCHQIQPIRSARRGQHRCLQKASSEAYDEKGPLSLPPFSRNRQIQACFCESMNSTLHSKTRFRPHEIGDDSWSKSVVSSHPFRIGHCEGKEASQPMDPDTPYKAASLVGMAGMLSGKTLWLVLPRPGQLPMRHGAGCMTWYAAAYTSSDACLQLLQCGSYLSSNPFQYRKSRELPLCSNGLEGARWRVFEGRESTQVLAI